MSDYTTITYRDELLPDQSVRRTFSDGSYEWRRRLPDGRVEWQDSRGVSGVDELLGKVVKRTLASGLVRYGREQGYGRTAWVSGASRVLTINQTSFGGQIGVILAGVGAGMLLGAVVWPPEQLSAAEEEQLRQAARDTSSSSGGDTGSTGEASWGDDDGRGGGDDGGDSDFG
jgi:hypothetical protein